MLYYKHLGCPRRTKPLRHIIYDYREGTSPPKKSQTLPNKSNITQVLMILLSSGEFSAFWLVTVSLLVCLLGGGMGAMSEYKVINIINDYSASGGSNVSPFDNSLVAYRATPLFLRADVLCR